MSKRNGDRPSLTVNSTPSDFEMSVPSSSLASYLTAVNRMFKLLENNESYSLKLYQSFKKNVPDQ